MKIIPVHPFLSAYLQPCDYVDFLHPAIQAKAEALRATHADLVDLARASFHFVRDEIPHSWDAQRNPVTLKASEVLEHATGYCYAKSHLLAALLRANGIPAGLCYQRLSLEGNGAPYCLHGLNALWLAETGWCRIDARGNKPGVTAMFTPPVETLAFPLHDPNELDFPFLFAKPLPLIIESLTRHQDIVALYWNLPDMASMTPPFD